MDVLMGGWVGDGWEDEYADVRLVGWMDDA